MNDEADLHAKHPFEHFIYFVKELDLTMDEELVFERHRLDTWSINNLE